VYAALRYLWHWLTAVNEHSLHSPFLYNLYTKTIKRHVVLEDFNAIEQVRRRLLKSKDSISVTQLGASSKVNNELIRPIAAIAKNGITAAIISKMLFKLIHDFKCKNVVELGTSFGINTMYLAVDSAVNVYSFEGCTNTANIARDNFIEQGYNNIKLIHGNINNTLPEFVHQTSEKIDLVFIDANHKLEPTLQYFNLLLSICHNQSIIIIDDIYWSREMTMAWQQLQLHPQVTTTIDLYKIGIVFLKPELEKMHVKLMI